MPARENLLKAALAYAKRGWPIFPARADKTPYTSQGVLDATTLPNKIEEWWARWPTANIALDVGSAGMMVIDLDPGYDLKELEENVGKLPQTNLQTHTPRGGRHLFYSLADGELVSPSSSKIATHVDVRSFHSYVLLPPSQTKDGSYFWETDRKPAYRTDEMVRKANAAREKHQDRDNWIIDADLPDNVALATSWLRNEAQIAIEGEGGDHTAYATAAMLKSYGISEALALDLMWEHWNPRCKPPWATDEIDHLTQKVANAYAYNTSPPGNLTPAYRTARTKQMFEAKVIELPEGDERLIGRFRFVDRRGMEHIRSPRWIITDFLADESYCMLFGPYGTFKTFIALDIALSIACGFPINSNWQITQPGPILFAAGEGRSSLRRRVAGWEKVHFEGHKVNDFVLVDPVPTTVVSEEALEAFLNEALRRHPDGYRLTVIDTLGRAMEGADENSQKDASNMTALVQRIRHELGGSVLVLHHSGLQEDKRPRGSSVFGADADTLIRASRRGKDHTVSLQMVKQKDAPEWEQPKRLRLNEVRLSLGDSTLAAVQAPPPSKEEEEAAEQRETVLLELIDGEIKAVLESNPLKTWTQKELAEAIAMRPAVSIDSKTLANIYLIRVRETKNTFASTAYDPTRNRNAGRWRFP